MLKLHEVCITSLLTICTFFCAGSLFAQDVVKLDKAEVSFHHESTVQNVALLPEYAWQRVSLPFKSQNGKTDYLWFRIPLTQFDSDIMEAIYITNHAFDIEVYVDGHLLGGKQGPGNKYAMGWNIPQLFLVPDYLREQSPKEVQIKLRQGKNFTFLPVVYAGKTDVLSKRYNQRYFFQVKAAEWGWIASILLGIFSLFLWLKRKNDFEYFQFSVICFSWSMVLLYMILPFSPVAPEYWLKFGYANAEIAGVAMFFFVNRVMGFQHQKLEKLTLALMAVLILTYFLLPMNQVFIIVSFAHVLALLVVLYALWKTILLSIKTLNRIARTISVGGAGVGAVIAYDIASFSFAYHKDAGLPDFTIIQHGFLFLLITFFILLIQRFIEALESSEDLNNTLEEKVKQTSEALKKSYEDSRLLEIAHSTEIERQNIMRDLHDDIGAKLLSITSSSNSAEQAELGREALISMKDIVSQSNSLSSDINSTVIIAVTEMEARFESAQIKVTLEADKMLDEIPVPPKTCYHLNRILRELTTNILKHAKANEVFISYRFSDVLEFKIHDNGVGMKDLNNPVGNGLRNIQFRIQAINGSMQIQSENGMGISLTIPLKAS